MLRHFIMIIRWGNIKETQRRLISTNLPQFWNNFCHMAFQNHQGWEEYSNKHGGKNELRRAVMLKKITSSSLK